MFKIFNALYYKLNIKYVCTQVNLEDSLAQVQEENLALTKALTANKALLSSMASELAKKEEENGKLKKIVG